MTKTDLQSDLLADLQGAANARPLPASPPVPPVDTTNQLRQPTPVFDLRVTPLRWSRPSAASPSTGIGVGLRVGPVQVTLSLGS